MFVGVNRYNSIECMHEIRQYGPYGIDMILFFTDNEMNI